MATVREFRPEHHCNGLSLRQVTRHVTRCYDRLLARELSAPFQSSSIVDIQGGLFSTPDATSWNLAVYTIEGY